MIPNERMPVNSQIKILPNKPVVLPPTKTKRYVLSLIDRVKLADAIRASLDEIKAQKMTYLATAEYLARVTGINKLNQSHVSHMAKAMGLSWEMKRQDYRRVKASNQRETPRRHSVPRDGRPVQPTRRTRVG